MTSTSQHEFTATRDYPYSTYGGSRKITVTAGLSHLKGNARPYFSVTGEIGRPGARDCDACGCLHEDILKVWPELAPVIALHLSDDNGSPMHSEDNGWYWLAGYYGGADQRYHGGNATPRKSADECLAVFAEHVRIPLAEARRIADIWAGDKASWSDARRMFAQWLGAQAERFQAEADAACKLLDEMSATYQTQAVR